MNDTTTASSPPAPATEEEKVALDFADRMVRLDGHETSIAGSLYFLREILTEEIPSELESVLSIADGKADQAGHVVRSTIVRALGELLHLERAILEYKRTRGERSIEAVAS